MVYFIVQEENGVDTYLKVGYSEEPTARLSALQTGNPHKLRILFIVPGDEKLERRVQAHLSQDSVHLEWFRITERTRALIDKWTIEGRISFNRRVVNVRNLRQNLKSELANIPFDISINGEVVASVYGPGDYSSVQIKEDDVRVESAVLPRAGYRESDGVSFGGSVRPNPKPSKGGK